MPDPLSTDQSDDALAPSGRVRLAMADQPPEVPPSGKFPAGKTPPSRELFPMAESAPGSFGGAPAPRAPRRAAKVAPKMMDYSKLILDAVRKHQSGEGNYVLLDKIRHEVPGLTDQHIFDLADKGHIFLGRYDGPKASTPDYAAKDASGSYMAIAIPRGK